MSMINKLIRFTFSQNISNLAFRSISKKQNQPEFSNDIAKDKLNALANVIKSLSNRQLQYLIELHNAQSLQNNQSLADNKVISLGEERSTTYQYLYQQKWMNSVWKDTHLLSILFNAQGDQQIGGQQQMVKQIYDIELTSVDAGQKIKVIKVLREALGLGLKQAKQFVDKVPVLLKKGKKQEGQKMKEQLQKSGCVVTLK